MDYEINTTLVGMARKIISRILYSGKTSVVAAIKSVGRIWMLPTRVFTITVYYVMPLAHRVASVVCFASQPKRSGSAGEGREKRNTSNALNYLLEKINCKYHPLISGFLGSLIGCLFATVCILLIELTRRL